MKTVELILITYLLLITPILSAPQCIVDQCKVCPNSVENKCTECERGFYLRRFYSTEKKKDYNDCYSTWKFILGLLTSLLACLAYCACCRWAYLKGLLRNPNAQNLVANPVKTASPLKPVSAQKPVVLSQPVSPGKPVEQYLDTSARLVTQPGGSFVSSPRQVAANRVLLPAAQGYSSPVQGVNGNRVIRYLPNQPYYANQPGVMVPQGQPQYINQPVAMNYNPPPQYNSPQRPVIMSPNRQNIQIQQQNSPNRGVRPIVRQF